MKKLIVILVVLSLVSAPTIVRHVFLREDCVVKVKETYVKRVNDQDRFFVSGFLNGDSTKVVVFENKDSFWEWKFRSADLQAKLEAGKTYTFTVYGFRWGWRSWYKNIASVK